MRLLLAEDEVELSNAIVAVLKHNNYSVDAVYNGQDALDYIENGNYDAVILDIMMPQMDGITVLKRVRAQGNKIPIMILTAKTDVDDKVLGLDSGADDYMPKPFEMKELLARLRAITRRLTETSDNILTFMNLSLDRTTCIMSTDKGSYKLANKEYQLLEMLMSHPHKVISTDTLMEKIWGYDSESEINVVWVYISYLRKKLKNVSAQVQITASRNLGYCLEEL